MVSNNNEESIKSDGHYRILIPRYRLKENFDGVNESEKYLNKLSKATFLNLWSFQNVHKLVKSKQGNMSKEVCDLLVVFGNTVLIFSIKEIGFGETDNLEVNWKRWYRKAVENSVKQILGAQRHIRNDSANLYLDRQCKRPLVLPIDNPEKIKFHKIVVAIGASKACQEHINGAGSLIISTFLNPESRPFYINPILSDGSIVHVFDEINLDIVMRTLDTITDFVSYLQKKEKLFFSGIEVLAASEEDLLGKYLFDLNEDGEHDFWLPEESYSAYMIDEGFWENYINSEESESKKMADRPSYIWDDLINEFSEVGKKLGKEDALNMEKTLRILASINRTERRMYAKKLIEAIYSQTDGRTLFRMLDTRTLKDTCIFFLLVNYLSDKTPSENLYFQQKLVESYCMVVRLKYKKVKKVIGIGGYFGNTFFTNQKSIVNLDIDVLDQEFIEAVNERAEKLNLFVNIKEYPITELEYPSEKHKRENSL